MHTDHTTLNDLSILNGDEDYSLFNKLNFTHTSNGRYELMRILMKPLETLEEITGMQQTLQEIISKNIPLPSTISNGTVLMIEKFYETALDPIPKNVSTFTANSYKLLHAPDFSLIKYSVSHCFDFIKGMQSLVTSYSAEGNPAPLKNFLQKVSYYLDSPELNIIDENKSSAVLNGSQLLHLAYFLKYRFKNNMLALVSLYARIDAWFAFTIAIKKYNLAFPVFDNTTQPQLEAKGLFHLLLPDPIAYDVNLDKGKNFLFLTGANMAGKSTFIKSVGTAVYLAHLGMAVPAAAMRLSSFDGLLSNINVADNIARGESYFYNEVQRIKSTIEKINNGKHWLILIDELFKGTNVQDAMKCSTAVIKGLIKVKQSVFILSTHLYEIGEELKQYENIAFNYFETLVENDQLVFSYQLKPGISNDRLGYIILQREGVVNMLENL